MHKVIQTIISFGYPLKLETIYLAFQIWSRADGLNGACFDFSTKKLLSFINDLTKYGLTDSVKCYNIKIGYYLNCLLQRNKVSFQTSDPERDLFASRVLVHGVAIDNRDDDEQDDTPGQIASRLDNTSYKQLFDKILLMVNHDEGAHQDKDNINYNYNYKYYPSLKKNCDTR